MTYNATCQLISPARSRTATNFGEVTVEDEQQATDIRCMMTPQEARKVVAVMGELGIRLFDCRLLTTQEVQKGWRVMVQMDGDEAAQRYEIRDAHRNMWGRDHMHLTLERV